MNWRKWNRWIHRELGFLFFGMSIIYGISGIALNHGVARHWDPGVISRTWSYIYPEPINRSEVDRDIVARILDIADERKNFKQYYFPNEDHLMIYLNGGHIIVELATGKVSVTKVRTRPFFKEVNYLHYNKPKKLWTWFSDLFALALVLMAISGLFIIRGKKGITGTGGILTAIGILVPIVFLTIYLWF
jgi:hypothetical protein